MIKLKKVLAGVLTCTLVLANAQTALACTAVYAGKDVSADGTVMIGRTEDIGGGYTKNFLVHEAETHQKGEMYEDAYGFKMELPEQTYRYSSVEDSVENGEGERPYGEAGFNEYGVAVTATVSAEYNEKVAAVDPLVDTGICEISMAGIILSQSKTAREGIELMASIVDKHGAGEGNIIMVADQTEAWYMEILSGHQYVAVKMPTDKVAVIPNCFMLGCVDVESEDVIASPNLVSLAKDNGFLVEEDGKIHIVKTYSVGYDEYNKYRAWGGQRLLAPSSNVTPEDEFELFFTPDDKVSMQDLAKVESYRYEDTKYNADLPENEGIRTIGIERQAECHILQIRDNYPAALAGVEWLAMGNIEYSVYLPFYASLMTDTPDSYKITNMNYNDDSAYWSFRSLAALSAINRDKYGVSVRDFWTAYQDALIKAQAEVDKGMLDLYNSDPATASAKANELANAVSGEAISYADTMQSELMKYFAADQGRTAEEPFATSLADKATTSYSFDSTKLVDSQQAEPAVEVVENADGEQQVVEQQIKSNTSLWIGILVVLIVAGIIYKNKAKGNKQQ